MSRRAPDGPATPPVTAPDLAAVADARREIGRSGIVVSELVAEGRE